MAILEAKRLTKIFGSDPKKSFHYWIRDCQKKKYWQKQI